MGRKRRNSMIEQIKIYLFLKLYNIFWGGVSLVFVKCHEKITKLIHVRTVKKVRTEDF